MDLQCLSFRQTHMTYDWCLTTRGITEPFREPGGFRLRPPLVVVLLRAEFFPKVPFRQNPAVSETNLAHHNDFDMNGCGYTCNCSCFTILLYLSHRESEPPRCIRNVIIKMVIPKATPKRSKLFCNRQATIHGGRQLIQLFQQSRTLFGALALGKHVIFTKLKGFSRMHIKNSIKG